MAKNEDNEMRIRPETETTVVENNQMNLDTVEIDGTGGISNIDFLVEIQKMRSELLVATAEIKKYQKDSIQVFECKIEDLKKELSEKLESIEALIPKSDDNPEKSNNATKVASEKTFKLKHVFKNISNFQQNEYIFSEWENHYNVKWRIAVQRRNCHLGFYVQCKPIVPADHWSIRTKLECKVVNRNQDVVTRTWECCYGKHDGWGFLNFLEWEDMKLFYLVNGKLKVEVHAEIVETNGLAKQKIRKFDESQKDVSDVVLVVMNTKFYVSKMFLASQSSVFKALLFGNFSESK